MQSSIEMMATNNAIYVALPALEEMGSHDLVAKLAQKIALTIAEIKKHIDVMNGVQSKVADKFISRDASGNKIVAESGKGYKLDDVEGFQEEWDIFLKEETAINVWPLLSTDFGEKAKHKGNTLAGMMGIGAYAIVDDEKEDEKEE